MADESQVKELKIACEEIEKFLPKKASFISRLEWEEINFESIKNEVETLFWIVGEIGKLPTHVLPENVISNFVSYLSDIKSMFDQIDVFTISQGDPSSARDQLANGLRKRIQTLMSEIGIWLPALALRAGEIQKWASQVEDTSAQATFTHEFREEAVAVKKQSERWLWLEGALGIASVLALPVLLIFLIFQRLLGDAPDNVWHLGVWVIVISFLFYYAAVRSRRVVLATMHLASTNMYANEAVKWYRRAAKQGYDLAQHNLGLMYANGKGVPQDYAEAVKWYRRAAEQGDAYAQNNLGLMYANGKGVPQDYAEAVKWYRRAAKWYQGNATAQHNLGLMYANGKGVPQDYAEAVKWYRRAAEQGDAYAQNNLGAMYANGEGVPQDYAEAVKWYRLAAEQGDALAQNNLGAMYANGEGVPQDYAEAVKWYRRAAGQGYALAQNNLGAMYANGEVVPQDYAEAVKWYRLAAEQGHALAQRNLGIMYYNGKGVPQDYVRAHMWLNLAASRYPATVKEDREEAARDRDRVARLLSPEALARAQRMAREWRPAEADAE